MNERIQILAGQAEDYADGIVDQGGEFHEAYTQKLAELMVKDFIKVAGEQMGYSQYCAMREKITTHFGVEE
jgi:hypothetical protein